MGYVAVKGGTNAIEASIEQLHYNRIKGGQLLEVQTILHAMKALVDQVMSESSLYAPELAALAIKQAEGSVEEAVFILRAHRSTLPRLHYTETVETSEMRVSRRISASFKDIPGGQILGATTDYTHRLLDPELQTETLEDILEKIKQFQQTQPESINSRTYPKVVDYLREQGLFPIYQHDNSAPFDITKQSLTFPAPRSARLQTLTRGQTGAVTSLGYAALRGYGQVHPTVGEVRVGQVPLTIAHPHYADDPYYIGEVEVTEVESFVPTSKGAELDFEIGYGLCYGQNETKAIAMSILDQCLDHPEAPFPTHDEEFVLLHIDSVEASGFISHLKLPHYVTFQSKLDRAREVRKEQKQS
ncbi:carbon-phosphorus lyase complex subunit PhnI [Alkalihalobacillus sp. FSL R5-0424]